MKNNLFLYLFLSFLACSASCQEPNNQVREKLAPATEQDTEKTEESIPDIPEVDPYFNGTTLIDAPTGPNTIVRRILQDRKGNIWLASWDGIIRYDGNTFTNFTNKEGLMRYRVFSMIEDKSGNIWFGTIGAGAYKYDGEQFEQYTTKEGLIDNSVTCIIEDSKGNIWFGTGNGISILQDDKFTNFYIHNDRTYTELELEIERPMNEVNRIVEDRKGNFWIAMRGRTYFIDTSTSKLSNPKLVTVGPEEVLSFTNVRGMIEDQKGNMWFGGDDGLWQYDGKTYLQVYDQFVGYIYQDRAGHIWTSSESGGAGFWALKRYDLHPVPLNPLNSVTIKEENNMYFDITEDQAGNIWWGTLQGIYKYDGQTVTDFITE